MSKRFVLAALALLVAAASLLGGVVSGHAGEELPAEVKIASHYVRADGCHDHSETFTTEVPHPERLDRSYHGVMDGIEVRVTAANNGHSVGNFSWKSATEITYTAYAKGAGHWVDPPNVFGVKVGGGVCLGAEGGSMGFDVIAHYK
ncbi:hypothetical protein [Bradyrhizobium sp.]|uniref:hypothetical protein n=1 Tax=Bradyrhizobium sp. TaxID=376 RepID=UPI003C31B5BA